MTRRTLAKILAVSARRISSRVCGGGEGFSLARVTETKDERARLTDPYSRGHGCSYSRLTITLPQQVSTKPDAIYAGLEIRRDYTEADANVTCTLLFRERKDRKGM